MKIFIRASLILSISVIFHLCSCINRGGIEDSNDSSDKIPPEYAQLIKLRDGCCNKKSDSINFIETWIWKYRNPVSFFYVSGKYYLQIYKMDTLFNYSLKNAIKETFSNAHAWTYTPYVVDDRTKMEFLYNETRPPDPTNIYIDLYGDSTKILKKNDTVACYYTQCVNFSIKFDVQKPMDIYGESQSKRQSEIPIEIMFLKKNNQLYLLTLSAKDDGIKIKPGFLYKLIQ